MIQAELDLCRQDLDATERRVLSIVARRHTAQEAIGMSQLALETGLSPRSLRAMITHLRYAHNEPIGSSSRAGGYWYATRRDSEVEHLDEHVSRFVSALLNISAVLRLSPAKTLLWTVRRVQRASGEELSRWIPPGLAKHKSQKIDFGG